MVEVNYIDSIAVLKLNRGATNALNLPLFQGLAEALHNVEADPGVRAIVLTSANEKFFSIGFDIPGLFPLSREEFTSIYRDFNRIWMDLYTIPKPTVAAITGHAIAGGCILATCCDYRLMASSYEGGRKKLIGLNEIKLGVPVPYLADCILQSLVGTRATRDIVESGEFFPAEDAMEIGLVDAVIPVEDVLASSIEKAHALGHMEQEAFQIMKQDRVEGVVQRIRVRWQERQHSFIECWYADEAQALLKVVMEKF